MSSRERVILEQAAHWFAVLRSEGATDAEQRRWRDWLAADPEHARAWQRVETVGEPFRRAAGAGAPVNDTLEKARRAARRRSLRLLAGGGLTIGTGVVLGPLLPWPGRSPSQAQAGADWRTAVGERRQLNLPDGSRLAINTASAVDVDYGRTLRRVVLHAGEILVDSAPDPRSPGRALVVDTRHGRLTALGTRFAVRGDAHGSHVAVFEGTVRVSPGGSPRASEVGAGRQAAFTAEHIHAVGRADPWRESWSRGQLVVDDAALSEVIAELRRYTTHPIVLDPGAARLRLVGVYPIAAPAQDVPAMLAALEEALPVRVRAAPVGGWHIVPR
jgi:transmembrane sensor